MLCRVQGTHDKFHRSVRAEASQGRLSPIWSISRVVLRAEEQVWTASIRTAKISFKPNLTKEEGQKQKEPGMQQDAKTLWVVGRRRIQMSST